MFKPDFEKKIESILSGMNLELVDLMLASNSVLQVFIDTESDDGVTATICEKVSKQLDRFLLVEGFNYSRLEVSSPGLERPLKKLESYKRFIGKCIKVTVLNESGIKQRFEANIEEVDLSDQSVVLKDTEGKLSRVAFDSIEKARLVYKM
jgi:ribosome maturation factor RimP